MLLIGEDLSNFVNRQLCSLWGRSIDLEPYQHEVLDRLGKCFQQSKNKYFQDRENVLLPLHSVQYCIYLYFMANHLYKMGVPRENADMLYYLNKVLHSVELYYEIALPDIWGAEHPLGSVMGRAVYGNYFFFYQNCTVGGNVSGGKRVYPVLGENVLLYSNSSILGNSHVGNNVILSAGTQIVNENVQDNCLVFGCSPNLTIVQKDKQYIRNKTSHIWKWEGC